MITYSIYLVTNLINNKQYVGFTSRNPKIRWNEHKSLTLDKYHNYQSLLHKAIKKYGKNNFFFEILYQSSYKHFTRNVMESFYIDKLVTKSPNGYNLTSGGQGACGEENVMYGKFGNKNPWFGKKHNEKTKIIMREKKKDWIPWNKGKNNIYLQETLQNMSNSRKGNSNGSKFWYFTYLGKEIEIYNITQYCKIHNLNPGCMRAVNKGTMNFHRNYKTSLLHPSGPHKISLHN